MFEIRLQLSYIINIKSKGVRIQNNMIRTEMVSKHQKSHSQTDFYLKHVVQPQLSAYQTTQKWLKPRNNCEHQKPETPHQLYSNNSSQSKMSVFTSILVENKELIQLSHSFYDTKQASFSHKNQYRSRQGSGQMSRDSGGQSNGVKTCQSPYDINVTLSFLGKKKRSQSLPKLLFDSVVLKTREVAQADRRVNTAQQKVKLERFNTIQKGALLKGTNHISKHRPSRRDLLSLHNNTAADQVKDQGASDQDLTRQHKGTPGFDHSPQLIKQAPVTKDQLASFKMTLLPNQISILKRKLKLQEFQTVQSVLKPSVQSTAQIMATTLIKQYVDRFPSNPNFQKPAAPTCSVQVGAAVSWTQAPADDFRNVIGTECQERNQESVEDFKGNLQQFQSDYGQSKTESTKRNHLKTQSYTPKFSRTPAEEVSQVQSSHLQSISDYGSSFGARPGQTESHHLES